MKSRFLVVMAVSAFAILLTAASGAWAINVTIEDTIWNSAGSAPTGTGLENNEVEKDPSGVNMIANQDWDLEGFLWNINTDADNNITARTLTIVAGWNFLAGVAGEPWYSGDVFLAPSVPKYGATILSMSPALTRYSDAACTIVNPIGPYVKNVFGYTSALNVNWTGATDTNGDGIWNVPFAVQDLAPATLELAVYNGATYNPGSNPFRVASDPTSYGLSATFRQFNSDAALALAYGTAVNGITGWAGDNVHYSVTFTLTNQQWLDASLPNKGPLWEHFTMGCGNDDLMGKITNTETPEPMSMVMLGCLGVGMIGARRARKLRKAAK